MCESLPLEWNTKWVISCLCSVNVASHKLQAKGLKVPSQFSKCCITLSLVMKLWSHFLHLNKPVEFFSIAGSSQVRLLSTLDSNSITLLRWRVSSHSRSDSTTSSWISTGSIFISSYSSVDSLLQSDSPAVASIFSICTVCCWITARKLSILAQVLSENQPSSSYIPGSIPRLILSTRLFAFKQRSRKSCSSSISFQQGRQTAKLSSWKSYPSISVKHCRCSSEHPATCLCSFMCESLVRRQNAQNDGAFIIWGIEFYVNSDRIEFLLGTKQILGLN